jgi:8-oxo-dGTP diphosphatase
MSRQMHVVAAALVDVDGRVLINRRLPGTHMAGRWEFPGGKVHSGEDAAQALARELDEELGIRPTRLRPLIRIAHDYPDRKVLLDCWSVDGWDGALTAREGHPLAWVRPGDLSDYDLLEADRPMVTALRLPDRYAITDQDPARLLEDGVRLIQLRTPNLETCAPDAIQQCREQGATLLLNSDPEYAAALGADGVHLNSQRLLALDRRPLPSDRWVAASCHDARELAHARAIGCDFAVLGPVAMTTSHAEADPLGWPRFAALADCAGMPVYALGGMGVDDIETAWAHHGQGIAGISAFA